MACRRDEKGSCCHWRTFRFSLLFLVSVGAIVGVYQFRSYPEADVDDVSTLARTNFTHHNHTLRRRPSAVFDINDVITHDRWVILQPWGDTEQPQDRSSNTHEAREDLTCAVVESSVEQGWRPLVLAERVACCSKPRCVLLNSGKRARLPYELRPFLERLNSTSLSVQRNLAFLFAIQHGARFVMDWYLEDPLDNQDTVSAYQRRASQLLQSATLDVSLGLVLEHTSDTPLFAVSPRPMRRIYNPHTHFGQPDIWAKGFRPPEQRHVTLGLMSSPRARGRLVPRGATERPLIRRPVKTGTTQQRQRYRVCELRPPSIEKFVYQGSADNNLDVSAPAVVIPGDTLAPASSQTSLYAGEALWALALLPAAQHPVPAHLLRTLWAYPLLANIAASVKVSLSPMSETNLINFENLSGSEAASSALAAAVLRWRCSSRSTLTCVAQLGRDMAPLLGHESAAFLATWASDLKRLRYLEPPVVPLRRGGSRSPCLGHHGLGGLTFQAAAMEIQSSPTREEADRRTRARGRYDEELKLLDWIRQLDSSHNNNTNQSEGGSIVNNGNQPEIAAMTELPALNTFMAGPKRDTEQSSIQRETVDRMCLGFSDLLPTKPSQEFNTMLLIVSFNAEYDLLPMIEIVYRPHFQNILYCGPPHSSLDIYTHKFLVAENRTLSYLPASASGFECLVGAMEMGYHVDDYLFVTSDSLLLPWNMQKLDRGKLWFGSEKSDKVISKLQWRDIDPGGQKLPRVIDAVGQALKFIAHILGIHEVEHYDHDDEEDIISYEDHHGLMKTEEGKTSKPTPPHHEEVQVPELHLHAEGVTDGTNISSSNYNYDTKHDIVDKAVINQSILVVQDSSESNVHENISREVGSVPSPHPELLHISNENIHDKDYADVIVIPLLEDTVVENNSSVPSVYEKDVTVSIIKDSEDTKSSSSFDSYEPLSPGDIYSLEDTNREHFPENTSSDTAFAPFEPYNTTVAEDKHTIVDEFLEDEEHNFETSESQSTEEILSSTGLQDVASETPSDGVVQYVLSSTPSNIYISSDVPTTTPFDKVLQTTNQSVKEVEKEKDIITKDKDTIGEEKLGSDSSIIIVENGRSIDRTIPAYQVEGHEHNINITSFLDIDELTDSSLNPVHDTLSSHVAEDIEKSAENGFSKRKADQAAGDIAQETKIISKREAVEDDTPFASYIDRRMERTFKYIDELFSTVIQRINSTASETPPPSVNQAYRLDPRDFKHLRCYDTGMSAFHSNSDLCHSLRQFYIHLNEIYRNEGIFTPPYVSYPIYHVPALQQKAFYLLANVFLQFGVPDQVAVPLLLRGLAQNEDTIKLRSSFFGSNAPATVQPGYPLFDEKSQFLYPVKLQQSLHGDTRFRTVFCLKYLYKTLS